ncbi:MAG TPA: endonuclease/exonuclease/phosphatase family protein [Anaerolineae bacterium]
MTQITVATINLRNRADRWRERRHLLVAQLVDATPDLVSLQEIYFPIAQGRWLRNQINIRLSGHSKRPYRLIQKRKRHLVHGYFEGIGILSKRPVLYHDFISLGYGGRLALRASVELPSRQTMDFVAVHLHHVAHDREARQEQVMALMGWLNSHRPVPLQVVAGDFNEVPDGPAIQHMKQGFRSAYEEVRGREPLATYPTALVMPRPPHDGSPGEGWAGCLDYIFVSPAVKRVVAASLFCDKPALGDDTLYPSDHVGLIATLEI